MLAVGSMSDVLVVLPAAGGYRSPESKSWLPWSDSKISISPFSPTIPKSCPSYGVQKLAAAGLVKSRMRGFTVRAYEGSSGEEMAPLAPLQMESPIGQLLAQILQTHPHLLPTAIDQQLEYLANERDSQKKESSSSLHKRIAEVKEKDRRKALEEIIYCFIVHKFMEKEIILIPKVSTDSDPSGRVDLWPNQELKLESVHTPEAFEMIQSHLSLVIGDRMVGPLQSTAEISKIKLGKLYAASIMYGYFLKRIDRRFQLEGTVKNLPKEMREKEREREREREWETELDESMLSDWHPDTPLGTPLDAGEMMGPAISSRLRSYVMYLDAETLQRFATIRSGEVMSLIERQTQALFGRPDIKVNEDGELETQNDEILMLTVSGLTMLILEAVAFGTFLWDAEDYVESRYHIIKSEADI